MKTCFAFVICLIMSSFAWGQTQPATFITGGLVIEYNSRTSPGVENVPDVYTLDINVSNSSLFKGTIKHLPTLKGMGGYTTKQQSNMAFDINMFIVNPRFDPLKPQVGKNVPNANVGKLSGIVPITENNAYMFSGGTLKANTFGSGTAKDFESKYTGVALGKPPAATGFDKLKKEVIQIKKNIGGKSVGINVAKYDKMEFQGLTLGGGPVPIYPEVKVDGVMLYDYVRSAWYFQNIKISYRDGNVIKEDIIGGNIRWAGNEYQFDIRVNEPPASEASMFAGAADEASFFAVDDAHPSLTGVMRYSDSKSGDTVTSSTVTVNLTGNKLERHQVLYLTKLIFVGAIVPFNAE